MSITLTLSAEMACSIGERGTDGSHPLDFAIEQFAMKMVAPGVDLNLDTRRPETWESLPAGHPFGGPLAAADVEAIRAGRTAIRVAGDGTLLEIVPAEFSHPSGKKMAPGILPMGDGRLPFEGWAPGALPFGALDPRMGTGETRGQVRLPGGLPVLGSGSLIARGGWTLGEWDPATGRATLDLDGEFDPEAAAGGPGNPPMKGRARGTAVWDAARGVVVRSWMVLEATMGDEDMSLQVTARFEEELLE